MIDIKPAELGFGRNKNISVFRNNSSEDYAVHGHDFFEIELILSGHGQSTINGKEVILKPGRINFMTTRDFHDIQNDSKDRLHMACARFNQFILNPVILKKIFAANQTLTFQLDEAEMAKIKNIMDVMMDVYKEPLESMDELILTNLIETIIVLLLKKTDVFDSEKNENVAHISRAIGYLEANFYNDPTLAEAAEFVGLNKNYLSSVFHREAGKTFVQYSNNLKLKYAKNLLIASEMTVNEIYYKCGFRSISTFLHEFKKKYGVTPIKYRRNARRKALED